MAIVISLIVGVVVAPATASTSAGCDLHVVPGASGTGASWTDAIATLHEALELPGQTICASEGSYTPAPVAATPADADAGRTATFDLTGRGLRGGFHRNGDQWTRDPIGHPTVLTGDIGVRGVDTDNAYHVVTVRGGDATLDGLVIRDGRATSDRWRAHQSGGGLLADEADVTLTGVTFLGNAALRDGGAALVANDSALNATGTSFGRRHATEHPAIGDRAGTIGRIDPGEAFPEAEQNTSEHGAGLAIRDSHAELTQIVFANNVASGNGGGLDVRGADVDVVNAFFAGNDGFDGGAMHVAGPGEVRLDHVTMARNASRGRAAGLHVALPAPDGVTISRSIVWQNRGGELTAEDDATVTIDEQSWVLGHGRATDLDGDAMPRYIAPDEGDHTLAGTSPGADVPDLQPGAPVDINGTPRAAGSADAGAIEASNEAPRTNVLVSDDPATPDVDESLDRYQTTGVLVVAEPAAGVLGNDADPTDDPMVAEVVGDLPEGIELTLDDDGAWRGLFTYTPPEGSLADVTFTYVASDGVLASAPAEVHIIVAEPDVPVTGPAPSPGGGGSAPLPAPPLAVAPEVTANDDVAATAPGVPVEIYPAANDAFPEGAGATWTLTPPSNGTATVSSTGIVTYVPDPTFVGMDTFDYEVNADGASDTATISVGVGRAIAATDLDEGDTTSTVESGLTAAMPFGVSITAGTAGPALAAVNRVTDTARATGWGAYLSLPTAPSGSPHLLEFSLHRSLWNPDGSASLQRNGVTVADCRDDHAPTPAPCLADRSIDGDVMRLQVLALEGSLWSVINDRVSRVAGPTRIDTAIELSRSAFDRSDVAVLAAAGGFADALSGGPLAGSLRAPLLLNGSDALAPEVRAELTRLGAKAVVLLGGTASLSDTVAADLTAMGMDVTRYGGPDRFATAAMVAADLSADTMYLALGSHPDPDRAWPDAVAVAGLAARQAAGLVLTAPDTLPAATADAIRAADPTSVVILGGVGAIDSSVEQAVTDLGVPTVERIAGATRLETSAAVADRMVADGADPATTWVASAGGWADALAAGPAVARDGGVLVLSGTAADSQGPGSGTWPDINRDRISAVRIIGGEAALSDDVADGLARLLGNSSTGTPSFASTASAADEVACVPRDRVVPPRDGTDTDGDGLTDFEEVVTWGTAPATADSDGDGLDDHTEIYDMGFDPDRRPLVFNPLVADTADIGLDLASPPAIELFTSEDVSVGTEEVSGWEQSRSNGTSEESTYENSFEVGVEVGVEFEAEAGLFKLGAKSTNSFGFHTSYAHTDTQSFGVTTEVARALSGSQATIEERSTGATNGLMGISVDVFNSGHVSYRLDAVSINVSQRGRGGELNPVVTLTHDFGGVGRTLAPGQRMNGLVFDTDELSVATTRALLRNPSGLVFGLDDYEFSVLHTDSRGELVPFGAGFLQQSIDANTAYVELDDGSTDVQQHAVSAVVDRDPVTQRLQGITACSAVLDVLGLDVDLDEDGRLTRVDGVRVSDTDAFVVAHTTAGGRTTVSGGLAGIVLAPGDALEVFRVSDANADGLASIHEQNAGLIGVLDHDMDGDGLPNRMEVARQQTVQVVGQQPYGVFSSPLLADSDDDGLDDLEEYIRGTDPLRIDTDGDGLADGGNLVATTTRPRYAGEDATACGASDAVSDHQGVPVAGPGGIEESCDPLDADTNDDGITDGGAVSPLGDRFDDLLRSGTRTSGTGLHLNQGAANGLRTPALPLQDAVAEGPTGLAGPDSKVVTGDVNGDGITDLVTLDRGDVHPIAWCGNFADTRTANTDDETERVTSSLGYGTEYAYPDCPLASGGVPGLERNRSSVLGSWVDTSRDAILTVHPGTPSGFGDPVVQQVPLPATDRMWADVRLVSDGDLDGDGMDDVVLLAHGFASTWNEGMTPGFTFTCYDNTATGDAECYNSTDVEDETCTDTDTVSNYHGDWQEDDVLCSWHVAALQSSDPRAPGDRVWWSPAPELALQSTGNSGDVGCFVDVTGNADDRPAGLRQIGGIAGPVFEPGDAAFQYSRSVRFGTHPDSSLSAGWNGFVFYGNGGLDTGYGADAEQVDGCYSTGYFHQRTPDFTLSDAQLAGGWAMTPPSEDVTRQQFKPNSDEEESKAHRLFAPCGSANADPCDRSADGTRVLTQWAPTFSPRGAAGGHLVLGDLVPGRTAQADQIAVLSPLQGSLEVTFLSAAEGGTFTTVGSTQRLALGCTQCGQGRVRAVLADLDGIGRDELVVLAPGQGSLSVFEVDPAGGWVRTAADHLEFNRPSHPHPVFLGAADTRASGDGSDELLEEVTLLVYGADTSGPDDGRVQAMLHTFAAPVDPEDSRRMVSVGHRVIDDARRAHVTTDPSRWPLLPLRCETCR